MLDTLCFFSWSSFQSFTWCRRTDAYTFHQGSTVPSGLYLDSIKGKGKKKSVCGLFLLSSSNLITWEGFTSLTRALTLVRRSWNVKSLLLFSWDFFIPFSFLYILSIILCSFFIKLTQWKVNVFCPSFEDSGLYNNGYQN